MGRTFAEIDLETTALAECLAHWMKCPNAKEFAYNNGYERNATVQRVVFSICQTSSAHQASIPPTNWNWIMEYPTNHRQKYVMLIGVCRTNYHTIRLNEWNIVIFRCLNDPSLSLYQPITNMTLVCTPLRDQSVKYSKDGFCCRTNRLPSAEHFGQTICNTLLIRESLCSSLNLMVSLLRLFNDVLIRWLGHKLCLLDW